MNFTQGNRRDGRLVRRGCVRPGVGSGKIGWLVRGSVRQRELEGRCGDNIVIVILPACGNHLRLFYLYYVERGLARLQKPIIY